MKNYETLEIKVVVLMKDDIVRTSQYDNIGGIPGDWTNGTGNE